LKYTLLHRLYWTIYYNSTLRTYFFLFFTSMHQHLSTTV